MKHLHKKKGRQVYLPTFLKTFLTLERFLFCGHCRSRRKRKCKRERNLTNIFRTLMEWRTFKVFARVRRSLNFKFSPVIHFNQSASTAQVHAAGLLFLHYLLLSLFVFPSAYFTFFPILRSRSPLRDFLPFSLVLPTISTAHSFS